MTEATPIKNGMVVHSLLQSFSHGIANMQNVPSLLKRVIEENMWQFFTVKSTKDDVRYTRFEDFVSAAIPRGMGTDIDTLRNLCRDDTEVYDLIDWAMQNKVGSNQHVSRPVIPPPENPTIIQDIDDILNDDLPTQEESEEELQNSEEDVEEEPEDQVDEPEEKPLNNVKHPPRYPMGNSAAAGLRRLRNQRPDLHEKVVNEEMSVHAACVEAGFRKAPLTPIEQAKKAVQKMSSNELKEFREWLESFNEE